MPGSSELYHAVPRIVERLATKDEAKRDAAMAELRALGPEALEQVLAIADEEMSKFRRLGGYFLFLMNVPTVILVCSQTMSHSPFFLRLIRDILLIIPISITWFWILGKFIDRRSLIKEATYALTIYDDPRILRVLVNGTLFSSSTYVSAVVDRLKSLLPVSYLQEDKGIRPALCRILSGVNKCSSDTDFVLAILNYFDRCGARSELNAVRRLANGKGPAKRDPRIAPAAQACLAAMEARFAAVAAVAANPAKTLLRPSQAPADNLLRPAANAPDADERLLLRVARAEDDRTI